MAGASQKDWSALAREASSVPPPQKAQCKCAANWGLVRFLRAVAQDVHSSNENWGMVLRRAAKGLTEVDFTVGSSQQAVQHVHGVGPSVAGMLDAYWKTVPPPPVDAANPAGPSGAAAAKKPAKARKRASLDATADGDEEEGVSPGGVHKRWVPRYKTANFALLVTLDKLLRQGRATVTKAELVDATEASQLSSLGIKPKASNTSGLAMAGVTGAKFTYDGWSGFNKYLTQVPKGHRAPLCFTFGNPLHVRLTDEGRPFAEELHMAAEARGDCTCGLLPPPGAAGAAAAPSAAAAAAPRMPRTDGARAPSSAAPKPPPARAAAAAPGGAAPRVSLDDDCIILVSSDDEDNVPVARARPAQPQARAMPPPAAPPAAAQRTTVQRAAPVSPADVAPAAKRARTGDSAEASCPSGAASAGALGAMKPLPQWRLSALSNDEAHDVRLPPLGRDATFGQEYDIVLLVDCREQFAHGPQGGRVAGLDEGMQRLQQRGITAEERALPIGDALWIARHRRFPAQEYCLDLIVERKRVDDLESSIKDNRYKKQKFYLKRCGLRRPCYLLEGDPLAAGATGQTWRTKAVKTAMLTTEVIDGFQVLRTPDAHGTFDLYARLTAAQKELYVKRSAPAQPSAAGQTCLSFQQFCAAVAAAKAENKTVHALWGRMLTHISGVGGEVAEAVVYEYPTPSALFDAYARCPSVGAARDLLAPITTSAVKSIGAQLSAQIHEFVFQTRPGLG